MAVVLFVSLIVLLLLGVPVAVTLGLAALAGLTQMPEFNQTVIITRMFAGVNSFPIMAVPLFLLAGGLMDVGGISARLVNFANDLVGHIRAGLAMVTVLASMLFAGISGSGAADAAAVGSMLIPTMVRQGYDSKFATSLVAAAGAIGPIIPPSTIMVVLGVVAGLSIGGLFVGGILPGILIGLALMIVSQIYFGRNHVTIAEDNIKFSLIRLGKSFISALPALGAPLIILGGILLGVFTATEAAAVAVGYSIVVGIFVYRELTWEKFTQVTLDAVSRTSMVLLIIATASAFAWMIGVANLPQKIADLISHVSTAPWMFLLCVNLLFLVVGCFMESIASILVLYPILQPIGLAFGIDPLHLGIVVSVNLAIGMVTPPYGITLFTACTIGNQTIREVTPYVAPMVAAMICVLLLITFVPDLTLWLPRMFGY